MENHVISKKQELELYHLKDIILHSRQNKNTDNVIYVPLSRFRLILEGIRNMNGLNVDNYVDDVIKRYNFYGFYSTDIGDKNNNHYTVVRSPEKDILAHCDGCDCGKKRFINRKTGICFYKEAINSNYTTKIPKI